MAPPVTRNLSTIRDKLSPDGKLIVIAITSEIESLRNELNQKFNSEMEKLREEFSSCIAAKHEEMSSLKTELESAKLDIRSLRENISKIEASVDEGDSYQRRDTLIFSCSEIPAFQSNENCSNIARTLIREKLRLSIEPTISTAHRLGKLPVSASTVDRRPIIVKLCQRDSKDQIYSAARTVKHNGLYVNESLTPTRRSILYALRQIKRAHPQLVNGCSSFDGKVFAYTKPSPTAPPTARSIRVEINTKERLNAFCTDFIKSPLESFLNSWPQ